MLLSADWAGETIAWLKSHNIDSRTLLDDLGIRSRELCFGRQISARCFAAILDYGASTTGDENFGLHRGGEFRVSNGGVLAYLALSAETVSEAISYYQRYAAVVCDGFSLQIKRDNEGVRLLLDVSDPLWKTCRHLGAFTAARTISALRQLTGRNLHPVHLQFVHRPPRGGPLEYRRYFRCAVDFGSQKDSIKLSSATTAIRMPTADSRLGHMLRVYADGLLRQTHVQRGDSLEKRVAEIIRLRLKTGDFSLREVANRLNLSERTLRRRLKESRVKFSELLDGVRLDLANDWLARADFDLKHISFLLGYSEPAAFSRAYKRWTGKTPGQVRAR
jgi:AraC-like DNA-binding protein